MLRPRPKVTVIIAIYNAEKYLKETLDSLASQTYDNMEIIFVEDGSTDASRAILARYSVKDDRIRVLHQEYRSSNSSRAFNMGIDHAKGDYVLLLNDYDIFEPDLVECAVKKADSTGADVVLFDAWLYDGDTRTDRYVDLYLNRNLLNGRNSFTPRKRTRDLFSFISGATFTMLISRNMLNIYNIRLRDLDGAPDLEFSFLALACAENAAVCYRRLVHNRRYADYNHRTRLAEWPETVCEAYMNLHRELNQRALFDTYKVAFVNKVMEEIEYSLKMMRDEDNFLKLYGMLHGGYLHKLGVFQIPDSDFSSGRLITVRNAIRDCSPVKYLLTVKDDIIEKESDFLRLPFDRDRDRKLRVLFFGTTDPAFLLYYNALSEDELAVVGMADFHHNPLNPFVKNIDDLLRYKPDYILVVNPGESYFERVREALMEKGVEKERIIRFR